MSFIAFGDRRGRTRISGLLAVALIVLIGLGGILVAGGGCAKHAKDGQLYHCPMHPTYISDRPGDCPICGMRLVPMKDGKSGSSQSPSPTPASGGSKQVGSAGSSAGSSTAPPAGAVAYLCPMDSDSEVVAWTPGKCPKCGMNLVPASSLPGRKIPVSTQPPQSSAPPSGDSERRILLYRSPMDPSVTSPVPAKDAMGMDFVPVYEQPGASTTSAGALAAVPGYAPVTVSEEGLKLAGVRTAPVVREIGRAHV
jgi:hypothetical protein